MSTRHYGSYVRLLLWALLIAGAGGCGRFGQQDHKLVVATFNILQGGRDASHVGLADSGFDGSRTSAIASVIRASGAKLVGIQEDDPSFYLLNMLGSEWDRVGSIYSTYELTSILQSEWVTVCRVQLPSGQSIVAANCHWDPREYGPYKVREYLRRNGAPEDVDAFVAEILDQSDKGAGPRGYRATLDAIASHVQARETVVLMGDFNEPSHLDWTPQAAANGMDRWVKNPTGVPLRFPIRWKGSQLLAELGLRDVYRDVFPDESAHPGITWTPPYPDQTPGRDPYADQVLDRIDRIYLVGDHLRIESAAVIGESAEFADVVFDGRWPSDHRAVRAVFSIVD